ncbi:mechanosensitive ion channel domain-containing protein [Geopsychrobacter electrodiphilus]|uniref:mechanosensitive ion channel domain-containing protein n=1 Tax=Geopsychrobacter electrodiphilus TaxID=225196 RepID=UPI00037DDE26|nr:mechanosensitive ion channel domain-containing protein [Geopsychrobacter electrodiphilus]
MVLNRYFIILVALLLLAAVPMQTLAAAADTAAPAQTAPAAAPAAPSFPGLSELGPRTSKLTEFVDNSESRLHLLAELKDSEEALRNFTTQLQDLHDKAALLGDPNEWYVDRLSQFNNQFLQLKQNLEGLQAKLAERQKNVEQILSKSREESDFWQQWNKELKAQKVAVPVTTVGQVKTLLKRLEQGGQKTSGAILKIQEKTSTLQQKVNTELDRFAGALAALRKATFRKNEYSFFSPGFQARFTPELWAQVLQGWQTAKKIDWEYLQRYIWIFGVLGLGFIGLGYAIRRYRLPVQENKEWLFVLSHPFATGGFLSLILVGNLFPAPPTQLRFALMLASVVTGSILAAGLMENRRQVRMLFLAAVVLVLTTGFRMIDLPQPLYRIYIAFLAVATVPLLIGQIRTSLKVRGPKAGNFFRFLMRIAVVVLLLSFLTQMAGYMNFASWLLQAAFETGMVILFAIMILRLGRGAIDFVLQHQRLARHKFFSHYGKELALRFYHLLQMMVVLYCLYYLLPLWRLVNSSQEAWALISDFSIHFGKTRISLEMLILALISFYLAMQVSWLLQGLLETRLFYRKSVDRGVRDAIKKLVHYGMVSFGFLAVLSLLGMSLQNFVVILGAFGIGIGFGLQDIVNNFLSGLILLFERPVKVGDFIVVNEEWGNITKIGLRSTVVEIIDHSEIIVPNSQLVSEKVTNWTHSTRMARLAIPVGVAYGSDVPRVMQILTEIAQQHPDAVKDPAAKVLFMEFGDSSLNFEIRVFIPDIVGSFGIRSEMLQQIDARFREAGIEIPFPQRDLHLRSVDGQILEKAQQHQPAQEAEPAPEKEKEPAPELATGFPEEG